MIIIFLLLWNFPVFIFPIYIIYRNSNKYSIRYIEIIFYLGTCFFSKKLMNKCSKFNNSDKLCVCCNACRLYIHFLFLSCQRVLYFIPPSLLLYFLYSITSLFVFSQFIYIVWFQHFMVIMNLMQL